MKSQKSSPKAANRDKSAITPEARKALDRVERESESLGASSLARTADKSARDMHPADMPQDDPIELWGKRIGRGLALIVIAWLIYHLAITYILPGLSG